MFILPCDELIRQESFDEMAYASREGRGDVDTAQDRQRSANAQSALRHVLLANHRSTTPRLGRKTSLPPNLDRGGLPAEVVQTNPPCREGADGTRTCKHSGKRLFGT